jgi:Nif-specific regulatory protein
VVIGKGDYVQPQDLLIMKNGQEEENEYKDKSLKDGLTIFKKHFIKRCLEENDWNQTEAAKALDIQRTYLSRLIKELELSNKE